MAEKVGEIYYVVEAHTQKILDSLKPTNASIDGLTKKFGESETAGKQAEFQMKKMAQAIQGMGSESNMASNAMGNLVKVAAGLISLRTAGSIINMADAYQEYADRIQLATSGAEEYDYVQKRLLTNANATERQIEEAQELYLGTADSLRELGYSTSDVVDIGDSLSHSFAANAASGQAAQSAISAFSKSMVRGKVDAIQWISITAAAPTVINDIAKSTGRTTAEVRRMGSEGQISAKGLAEALRQSLKANKELDESMSMTVSGSWNKITNAMKVYVGELNRGSGATETIAESLTVLAESFDVVATSITIVGAAVLGKFIAGMAQSAIASIKAQIDAHRHAKAELDRALALERSTAAAAKAAAANARYSAMTATASAAAEKHAAATAAATAAKTSFVSVGSRLLGILGGPVGIVAMVASAAAAFLTLNSNARKASLGVDILADSLRDMNEQELKQARYKQAEKLVELRKSAEQAGQSVQSVTRDYEELVKMQEQGFNISAEEMENVKKTLIDTQVEQGKINKDLEEQVKLEGMINELLAEQKKGIKAEGDRDPEADKRLKAMRDELELVKLTGEARAKLQAIQRLGDNATEEQKKEAAELAAQIYQYEEARKKAATANKKGLKESEQAAKENKKAVADLTEELKQAALGGKALAEAQALAKLNKFATPDDIARVKALAGAIYELELAEQNRQMLADMDPVEAERQRFEEQLGNLKRLHEAKLLEDQRYYDLKEGLEREHNERMRQAEEERFEAQNWQNEMLIKGLNGLEQATASAMTGLLSGASNSTQAIQALAAGISQELISSIVKMGFEQVKAWAMGQVAQKAAAAGYVASVAGQVKANTALAAQAAFTSTAAIPITGPAMAPAAAAAAASTSASLGAPAIAAAANSYGGGRQYGGPAAAGKMYRINEDGKPEVFNAANGQQYLLPNTRGQVVSNKDAAAGGSNINVSVTVHSNGEITSDIGALTGMGQDIGRAVQAIVKRELNMAMQPGGVIRSRGY